MRTSTSVGSALAIAFSNGSRIGLRLYRLSIFTHTTKSMPPKKKKVAQRVLVDGLTEEQDELLRTVQYRQGNLSGRDS